MKKYEKGKIQKIDYLNTGTNLTNRTIDFSKINKSKIQEYIELMEEHQKNCVKIGNFIEAELAKQRVIQLRKIQEKKDYSEAKKRQSIDRKNFNKMKEKELKEFKKEFDNKYVEEMTKLDNILFELRQKHEQELSEYFSFFEKNFYREVKLSNELIEKQKQLEYYIKTEE